MPKMPLDLSADCWLWYTTEENNSALINALAASRSSFAIRNHRSCSCIENLPISFNFIAETAFFMRMFFKLVFGVHDHIF